MLLTRRIKARCHRTAPKQPLVWFMDEYSSYASTSPALFEQCRSHPIHRVRVIQFMIQKNSGQRVRMVGLAYWEDTGEPIRKQPAKFIPAQVRRRQVPIDWDQYETELAVKTLRSPVNPKAAAIYARLAAQTGLRA